MRADSADPVNPYEVHCNRCRVSHPVGTRRCIHCGGPVQAARPAAPIRAGRAWGSGRPELVIAPVPPAEATGELDPDELELPRRGGLSPFTFVWVLLALAGAMYRVCTPG